MSVFRRKTEAKNKTPTDVTAAAAAAAVVVVVRRMPRRRRRVSSTCSSLISFRLLTFTRNDDGIPIIYPIVIVIIIDDCGVITSVMCVCVCVCTGWSDGMTFVCRRPARPNSFAMSA